MRKTLAVVVLAAALTAMLATEALAVEPVVGRWKCAVRCSGAYRKLRVKATQRWTAPHEAKGKWRVCHTDRFCFKVSHAGGEDWYATMRGTDHLNAYFGTGPGTPDRTRYVRRG